jgi:DNA polymerase I
MNHNKLVYGKNEQQNIVSIEQNDSHVELFVEKDGVVTSEFLPSKYWLLASKSYGNGWVRLDGDLHYKWGKQFQSKSHFLATKNQLRNEDVYAIFDAKEMCMVNKGITYFKGMKIEDVSVLSFDIETTSLDPASPEAKVLLISTTYRSQGKIKKRLFSYDDYENEGYMIGHFCEYVREMNPSVLLGHNIFCFDLPYLKTRAEYFGVDLLLGRDGSKAEQNKYESKFRKEATQFIHYKKFKVYGREIIDTLFLSIKHDMASRKYDSYGLKNIIKQEGLEKQGRVFYDASLIRVNYKDKEEFKKIKEYCIDDSDDSLMLFDLMIPALFYANQSVPKSFQELITSASGSQVNSILVRAYLQDRHSIPRAYQLEEKVEGGISFGVPGIYKNFLKVDLKSAYPSQILRFKLYDKEKDPKGCFYQMVKFFAEERFKLKELSLTDTTGYYVSRDNTAKIFLNSMYGVCNTNGLNFNAPSLAAKITKETRDVLNMALVWASGKDVDYWRQKCE